MQHPLFVVGRSSCTWATSRGEESHGKSSKVFHETSSTERGRLGRLHVRNVLGENDVYRCIPSIFQFFHNVIVQTD